MTRPADTVWVMPSIDPEWRLACQATMHPDVADRLIVVDNTTTNRGVAASWNVGWDAVCGPGGADWLVVVSESMRFGPAGGVDFAAALGHEDEWVDSTFGWHLVAFRRSTLKRTGRFDENFWPAYHEDSDYLIRLDRAGYASPRENRLPHRWVETDAATTGYEHTIRAGLVEVNLAAGRAYFEKKWGTPPPSARFGRPFAGPRDWTWWPEPNR